MEEMNRKLHEYVMFQFQSCFRNIRYNRFYVAQMYLDNVAGAVRYEFVTGGCGQWQYDKYFSYIRFSASKHFELSLR